MANEFMGRAVAVKIGTVYVATARTKSLTINNEAVDITSDGDKGIQRMLARAGQKGVEISIEGLEDLSATALNSSLFKFALDNGTCGTSLLKAVSFEFYLTNCNNGTNEPDFILSGDFFLASYQQSHGYNEAVTFSASFNSSGLVTTSIPT
ncbi:MAG: phage tail protein [Campylobacteraceae bacterium]|jgi:predicted secreted protein|nr:phage tail protein [Campylobacteraceae bacterium]